MKNNPLYAFLHHQQDEHITQKEGYVMLGLERPRVAPMIQVGNERVYLHEHHLSVREEYEEGTGFRSLYHYTAYFEQYVVHVYFDKNGHQSVPYIREVSSEYKTVNEPLLQTEMPIIRQLFLQYVEPKIHRLNRLHTDKIIALRNDFYPKINEINAGLFEHSDDIEGNIAKIDELIHIGSFLKQFSFHMQEIKIIGYLQKLKQVLLLSKKASFVEVAPDRAQANMDNSEAISPAIRPVQPFIEIAQMQLTEEVKAVCHAFEERYQNVATLIHAYDHIAFADFESKVTTLDGINQMLVDLFVMTEQIDGLDEKKLIQDKEVLKKSSIGIECLRRSYQEKGTLLLTLCLSSPARFDAYGERLFRFAQWLDLSRIDAALKKGNVTILAYFLKYTSISIDQYRLQLEPNKPGLSLVAAAYQLRHEACLAFLVKRGANVFSIYDDELPLAHFMYNLPGSDHLRQVFFDNLPGWPEKSSGFFSALAAAMRTKLLDPDLLMDAHLQCLQRLKLYEASSMKVLTSKAIEQEADKLRQLFNQDEYEALKNMPEYAEKMNEQTILQAKIKQLTDKLRISTQLKGRTNQFFKGLNQNFASNDAFRKKFSSLTKKELLKELDENISRLHGQIFLLENRNKRLSKADKKKFDAILEKELKVEALANESKPSPIDSIQKELTLMIDTLVSVLNRSEENADELDDFDRIPFKKYDEMGRKLFKMFGFNSSVIESKEIEIEIDDTCDAMPKYQSSLLSLDAMDSAPYLYAHSLFPEQAESKQNRLTQVSETLDEPFFAVCGGK